FTNGLAGTNVNLLSAPVTTGGTTATFATVSDGGGSVVPAALPYSTGVVPAPAAAGLQVYLHAIPALANNVTVIGVPGGPFSVIFRNGLGAQDVSDTALTFVTTGGTTASVATDSNGGNVPVGTINGETQLITFGGTITGGTFVLNFNNYTTAPITFDPNAATGPAANSAAMQAALPAIL